MASTTDMIDADAPDMDAHAVCANCGTAVVGDHCHGCGQAAHVHRSVAAIGHDLMHGVLHLDGKLANTLPLLAFKPGQLTRRYVGGERRRFVSPMGMFLFAVTVLFLVMQTLGVHPLEIGEAAMVGPALARADAALLEIASADSEAAGQAAAGSFSDGFASGARVSTDGENVGLVVADDVEARDERRIAEDRRVRARTTLPLVRRAQAAWGEGPKIVGGTTGSRTMDTVIKKAISDPALVAYKVQANSYKFSWALIPLSVPFVWLLFFWRRDVGLYDHTIFVTYSLASVTLLSVLALVLTKLGVPQQGVWSGFCLLVPAHIWVHLRGSYGLTKRGTLWRFALLSGFIWLAVGLFVVILLALGALG